MIVLGLLLLILGYLVGIGALVSIGWVLIVVGIVLLLLGTAAPWGGRWY